MRSIQNVKLLTKVILFTLFALSASACGKKQETEGVRHDAALVGIMDSTVAAAAAYGVKLDFSGIHVEQGSTPSGVVAYCNSVTNSEDAEVLKRNGIVVGSTFMSSATAVQQAVLSHEFGHCGLGSSHNNSVSTSGLPLSLMYAWTFSSAIFTSYEGYYFNQLVNSPSATNYPNPN